MDWLKRAYFSISRLISRFWRLIINNNTHIFLNWPHLTRILSQRRRSWMSKSIFVEIYGRAYFARNVGWRSIFRYCNWIRYYNIFFLLQQYPRNWYFWFGVTFQRYTTSIYKLRFYRIWIFHSWIFKSTSFNDMFIF